MKDKEAIYDAEISPLMAQILAICKREKIAMIASFNIPNEENPDLACSSMLPDEDGHPEEHEAALEIIRGGSGVPPMKITTRNADGSIAGQEIVVV